MTSEINIKDILASAKEAGNVILEIYKGDFSVTHKDDKSPLTEADQKAHEIIVKRLAELYPHIPILSEESKEIPYEQRKDWEYFWLVDPLDGTKEFINKYGEFTVNIALIYNHKPILGVIYVPTQDVLYYAQNGLGSFKQLNGQKPTRITARNADTRKLIVVASRSHFSKETEEFIKKLEEEHEIELEHIGSSLKFCLVAEGKADIYPKLGPTMEWDTAAAHAIVNESGKKVMKYDSHEELTYNKKNLLNPWFVVR